MAKKFFSLELKNKSKKLFAQLGESVNQPYVVERWVGGMLTNAGTINQQIKKLKTLEKRMESGELAKRY